MLPSSTGMWVRNTRSPANRVLVFSSSTVRSLSLCAAGHARKVSGSRAEIELERAVDQQRRRHDAHLVDQLRRP